MAEEKYIIFGLYLDNRVEEASEVQGLLTEYGCSIKTRLGMHETGSDYCSQGGLILLEMCGDKEKVAELETKLKGINGVKFQKMVF